MMLGMMVIARDRDTRFLFVRLSMSHRAGWELCAAWDVFQVPIREALHAATGPDIFWWMPYETSAVTLYSKSVLFGLQVRSTEEPIRR